MHIFCTVLPGCCSSRGKKIQLEGFCWFHVQQDPQDKKKQISWMASENNFSTSLRRYKTFTFINLVVFFSFIFFAITSRIMWRTLQATSQSYYYLSFLFFFSFFLSILLKSWCEEISRPLNLSGMASRIRLRVLSYSKNVFPAFKATNKRRCIEK